MIALGSDHGGYSLKEEIKKYLDERDIKYIDLGNDGSRCDYPDIAQMVCEKIIENKAALGILFCGTGIGMSIAANKIRGIRAAVCSDYFSAKYTRLHNDANVLCLGGRVLGAGAATELVEVFLSTDFEQGGRHSVRVDKISKLENDN
ncbi:MAG: ribose 5-phosphate isomerase B [Clostridiales bacterium]|nr:ribose 5-phosphate isomerase B [Clostridiales bacterium]